MKKPSAEQRKLLGNFLATKRACLQPVDFGLRPGSRRTPGLRREEVAILAGVSVSWYTWLEQGRDIQASGDLLRRVSKVLRLDRVEATYLFALSDRALPSFQADDPPTDALKSLLEALGSLPAYIRNSRFDVLAWNEAATRLFINYSTIPLPERNALRLLFLHEPYRTLMLDWEQAARNLLSTFRAARAKAQDKTPFDGLIEDLSAASPEFRSWWPDVDVKGSHEGCERLCHPTMGYVDFTYVSLAPEGQPDLSIVAYIPQGTPQALEY